MRLFIVLDIPAENWLPWFLTLVQICGITELLRDPSFLQNVGSMSVFGLMLLVYRHHFVNHPPMSR